MKTIHFALPLLIVSCLLSACGSGSASYRVESFSDSGMYPDYSLKYPSDWTLREKSGHLILIASDPELLEGPPPAIFTSGQVMVAITMLAAQPPLQLLGDNVAVNIERSRLDGLSMNDPLMMPSAYYEGIDSETGETSLLLVRGMLGQAGKSYAVLLAHFAGLELDRYKDVIVEIAESLDVR